MIVLLPLLLLSIGLIVWQNRQRAEWNAHIRSRITYIERIIQENEQLRMKICKTKRFTKEGLRSN